MRHNEQAEVAIPGPGDIIRRELDNGLVILTRENFSSPAVLVHGYLPVGSVFDGRDLAGLASFTAGLLDRGSAHWSYEELNETVEGLGASLDISAGRHRTSFQTKSLSEDLETMLDLLADVLQRPTFPAEHVERVRGQWLTDLQERDHDTRRMAALAFRELLYAEHPYGRSSAGYHETAQAITRSDVVKFYEEHFGPRGGVVAVVGAVNADRALALVDGALGGWSGATQPLQELVQPPDPKLDATRRRMVEIGGKTQADIVLGYPGLARKDAEYYAAAVANTVLGRFGMYGRLGLNVREKQGLAYYCLSSLDAGRWPGPWYVFAGVNPANVDRATESVLEEVTRLGQELVPTHELDDTKAYLTGSVPLRLETNEGVAATLLAMERYELGLDYLERFPGLVNGVRAEEVQAVAQRYLDPSRYAIAIAGPPEAV